MDSKKLSEVILTSKDIKAIKWICTVFGLCLFFALIMNILYSQNIMTVYLEYFLNDLEFPIYILIVGSILGIPMYNISKFCVNNYEKGKALPYILLLLSLYSALCLLFEHYVSQLFPVFTQFLNVIVIFLLILFGLYATLVNKLSSNKKTK